jgi:UDP-N-acetylmuramoyl-tripeptide--D-alanyl-D-alanine ligase
MSAPFSLADAARWTRGVLARGSGETVLSGVSIDTRILEPGRLFVAIRGERHDAHAFLSDALSRGATALMVERGRAWPGEAGAVLEVDDTTGALGALAAGHRAGFHGPLVAITGSNGKTTTKEMCVGILGVERPCLGTRGNLNNQYGLPLTLLEREADHGAVVVELGMNHAGEIAPLAAIAQPTVGVLTNVGTAHVEHLGSREAIAREKGELLAALPETGVAVLNADDLLVLAQAPRTRARVVTYGRGPAAQVRPEKLTALGERGFAFDLVAPEGRCAVHVVGLGETLVTNALAAAAAALAAGASLESVASGLARFRPVAGRLKPVYLSRNIILINDTYNANPQSVEVALRSLAELKGSSRGLAVLGDMAELGDEAESEHRAVGRLVAELGIEFLFALGPHGRHLAQAAIEAGMDPARVHVGRDHEETSARVAEILQGNDWVLVKGSRSMRMERVVERLSAEDAA